MNRFILVILFILSVDTSAQEIFTIDLSVPSNEKLGASVLADINGDGEQELCVRVKDLNTEANWLVAWDLKFQREMGRIPITYRGPYFFSTDIDGDGKGELVTINTVIWGNKPGFIIFRWEQGQLTRTEYTSFYGDGGLVGDIDGDGRDEIILDHLPKGFTNSGGTGPVEIQAIAWNGVDFELKAHTSFPATYFKAHVGDLNGNGRDEITILRSGHHTAYPRLSVFGYTHSRDLILLDEWESPNIYKDNLIRLWSEPLPGNKQRIIIPIPEQYWEGGNGVERVQFFGFQLTLQGILPDRDPLLFDEFRNHKHNGSLPIFFQPAFQRIDIDQDGQVEVLRIENNQTLKFVRPVIPVR